MRLATLSLALLAVLPGCYKSFDATRGDGGALEDGATPEDDAAPAPDATTPVPPPEPEGPCERGEIVPPYEGPGCATATLACLETCAADPSAPPDCSDACLASDPECVVCFNQTIIACSNRLACQGEWNAFACCTETSCPGVGDGVDRLFCAAEGACLEQLDEYATCADGGGFAACNTEVQRCFER